jgi:hypothetical protein
LRVRDRERGRDSSSRVPPGHADTPYHGLINRAASSTSSRPSCARRRPPTRRGRTGGARSRTRTRSGGSSRRRPARGTTGTRSSCAPTPSPRPSPPATASPSRRPPPHPPSAGPGPAAHARAASRAPMPAPPVPCSLGGPVSCSLSGVVLSGVVHPIRCHPVLLGRATHVVLPVLLCRPLLRPAVACSPCAYAFPPVLRRDWAAGAAGPLIYIYIYIYNVRI